MENAMSGSDYEKLTSKELKALLEKQEAKEKAELAKRGVAIKKEVETYVKHKYGLTLAQIYQATDKEPDSYRCPTTGIVWNGKGKRPIGLKSLTKEQLKQHKVDANELPPSQSRDEAQSTPEPSKQAAPAKADPFLEQDGTPAES